MNPDNHPADWALPQMDLCDDLEPRPAALNMAIDEALLAAARRPILRFYRWQRPSLSFGYFGRYADVAPQAPDRDLVRRWTGGGIVLHGTDVTYSFILPQLHLRAVSSARDFYALVHTAIRHALSREIAVELAAHDAPKVSDACFANPVTSDVLVSGRKIAGAAQRRTRAGLLLQGSIQYPALPLSFRDDFARALCSSPQRQCLSPEVLQRAAIIAAEKYGTDAWLRRY